MDNWTDQSAGAVRGQPPVEHQRPDVGRPRWWRVGEHSPTRPPTRPRPGTATTPSRTSPQAQGSSAVAVGGPRIRGQPGPVGRRVQRDPSVGRCGGVPTVSPTPMPRRRSVVVAAGRWTQSNSAENSAEAGNDNITDEHRVSQGQGSSAVAVHGGASGASQSQDASVDNWTDQSAGAVRGQPPVEHQRRGRRSAPPVVAPGSVTQSNDATNSTHGREQQRHHPGPHPSAGRGRKRVRRGHAHGCRGPTATTAEMTTAPHRTRTPPLTTRPISRLHAGVDNDQVNVLRAGDRSAARAAATSPSPTTPPTRPQRATATPTEAGCRAGPGGFGVDLHRGSRLTSPMPQTSRRTPL